ncbi:extracellular solute-binding protein [Kineothrix sp. MB12-C1]|uniref:extracellular solute-binding protein n=1 Tax=Kineothrix sp. MB12-C1 TaxID=3070215 RepID=UPI0027D2A257|nr:extracellular solute-binding protein [Kineothrix sp. MB12-C1]WMC91940.1 extracellular solute-binding protein [Kineothrix sp. MB12-C1]
MKKNLLKRIFTAFLAAAMMLTMLAGCGGTSTSTDSTQTEASNVPAAETDSTQSQLEPVTLTLWSCSDKYSAQDEVLAAFCEKYKDQLNIDKIEYNFVSFGDYEDKMTSLVAGGDDFDGFYVSDWMLYTKMANKGAFLPLNSLMEQYAPTLYQTYLDNGSTVSCSIGGEMVALPWVRQKSSKPILFYRKDLAEQYGVDTSKLETIEDLDAFLTDANEKISNIITFESGFPRGNTYSDVLSILHCKYEMDSLNYHMYTYDYNAESITLQPIEQTEMFKEAVTWMKKWYDGGIVSKNELSETDTKMFENGKTFAKIGLMENAQQGVAFNIAGAEYGWAEIYPDGKHRLDSPLNNAFAINKNAANPERLLMLLELLNTDEEAYDMFMYGIEGMTYVKGEDGSIQYPEGQDASTSTYLGWFNWPFVREQFNKPSGIITQEALDNELKWLQKDNFVMSPLTGFNPDTSEIKTELAQRDQLYDEQGKLLLAGITGGDDVDTAIRKYIDKQTAAGIDKITAFMQTQSDLYTGN